MFQNEFGGLPWFSFAALGLTLLIGYVILRAQQAKAKTKKTPRVDQRTALERELQAEIDAAENRRLDGLESTPASEPEALQPPPDVQAQMDEIRRKL